MNLKQIIELLEQQPPDLVFPYGFGAPACWEGDWYEIAFEPAANVTVKQMLQHARSAVGATLLRDGGGAMEMDFDSLVHIARRGEFNLDEDPLSIWRFRWMVKVAQESAA
jgi:hypothetical protein